MNSYHQVFYWVKFSAGYNKSAETSCSCVPYLKSFIIRRQNNVTQQDFLDLITALLKLTVFLALQSQCSAYSKVVLDVSLITVDTTSLE